MRCLRVLVPSLALVASLLVAGSMSAAGTPPGDTPDTGELTVTPATPVVGDVVKLKADFPTSTASSTVTFFKKIGDVWSSIDTDESNSNGNAYLDHQVNEAQDIYARITSGSPAAITETETITPTPAPVITPDGPDTGNLSTSPSTYAAGDSITITANFPDGTFPVSLYKETTPNVWSKVATKQSSSGGNASFPNFPVTSDDQRVFARKPNGNRTEVRVIAPLPTLDFDIRRDCTGNTCASSATARLETDPAKADRAFKLQYLSGSTWKQVGSDATTGADGTAAVTFSLTDTAAFPQWSPRKFRMVSAGEQSLTSPVRSFIPGPTELGPNVLRVDVEDGIFPTTKGPEYTGDATLSVGGVEQLTEVPLESFGVRGNSSVKFTKKPYKLKFLTKPPTGKTVFGMPRARSWTLLASWRDRSLVREKAILDLGRRLAPTIFWTPQSSRVEMFVNGQYRGSYLMTESVKIDGDRVKVDPVGGMIMETDGFQVENSSLGFTSSKGIVFAFKDPDERKTLAGGAPDPEGVTTAKFDAIKKRINAFETKLYSSSTRHQYPDFIDVASAIDYWLIREFAKDHDVDFRRSHYFSWDPSDPERTSGNPLRDGKFHFGPAWDFDTSAGNAVGTDAWTDYLQSPEGWGMRGTGTSSGSATYRTHWFVQLFRDPGFLAAAKARWDVIKGEFAKVHTDEVATLRAAVGVGAENDRARWASEPRPPGTPTRTYDEEITYLTQWYEDRFAWMDDQLTD